MSKLPSVTTSHSRRMNKVSGNDVGCRSMGSGILPNPHDTHRIVKHRTRAFTTDIDSRIDCSVQTTCRRFVAPWAGYFAIYRLWHSLTPFRQDLRPRSFRVDRLNYVKFFKHSLDVYLDR